MACSTTRRSRRLGILLTILAGLVAWWCGTRGRYWPLNSYAALLARHGANFHGEYVHDTEFEHYLRFQWGLDSLLLYERLDQIDMLAARDIDKLLARIGVAAEVDCVKIGPNLREPDALRALDELPGLTDVIIAARNTDDRWLEAVCGGRSIRRLSVRGGRITDEGLRAVARMSSLQILTLPDSAVTDEGIGLLESCTALTELDLRGSAVTDASVARLAALPNLVVLNVERTQISDEGAAELRRGGVLRLRR